METLELTWGRLARVWWSLTWRGLAFSMVGSISLGTLVGVLGVATGAGQDTVLTLYYGVSVLVWIPAGLLAVWFVLHKRFREFRLALTPREGDGQGETLALTGWRLARVWWSLFWRGVVLGVACGALLQVAVIPAAQMAGAGEIMLGLLYYGGAFLLWIPVGFVVLWSVFRKRFTEFRLVLVPREDGVPDSP